MRVRLIALPKRGDLDEFDLRRFHVGDVYDLPPQLASILLIGGYAELAAPIRNDIAADANRPKASKFPKSEF
jgi:hypothetical protein